MGGTNSTEQEKQEPLWMAYHLGLVNPEKVVHIESKNNRTWFRVTEMDAQGKEWVHVIVSRTPLGPCPCCVIV